MLYVVNDIHGNLLVSKKVADFILDSFHGDSLIINGDFAGARGPVLSELAKYYYAANNKVCSCHDVREVLKKHFRTRIECPDELIFKTADSGVFMKVLADQYPEVMDLVVREELEQIENRAIQNILKALAKTWSKAILVCGNGEILITDHIVDHTNYSTAPKYQAKDYSLYSKKVNLDYVSGVKFFDQSTLMIGIDALEQPEQAIQQLCRSKNQVSRIFCHYPPAMPEKVKNKFSFNFKVNRVSARRMANLAKIIQASNVKNRCSLFYGHYHPAISSPEHAASSDSISATMQIGSKSLETFWIKPGVIFSV